MTAYVPVVGTRDWTPGADALALRWWQPPSFFT